MSRRAWLIIAALLIVAAAASRLWLLPIRFSADPNEGWNAFQALQAMGAGPLYPPPGALTANNYPPLSFYFVGGVGTLIGDPIVAGRIVALFAVLGIAALVFAILRRLGRPDPEAAIGALLFLVLNATVLRDYLALNDPQWLGHLLVIGGVLTALPASAAQSPSRTRLILAAVLMLLGGLTKHNLVAWPIVLTLWLSWHHRALLGVWIGGGLIGLAAALLGCLALFGPDFFTAVLGSPRSFSIDRIVYRAGGAILVMLPLLWWSWPFLRRRPADPRLDLVRLGVLLSVVLGLVQRGGAGVHINAHFDSAIALSLSCALVWRERWHGARPTVGWVGVAALFVAGAALEAREIRRAVDRYPAWQAMERRIAAIPGDVACETQALCFWAGKRFAIDFFLVSQRARKTGDTTGIDQALAERRFAAVQIDANPPPGNPDRATDPVLQRLERMMRPVFVDAGGRQLLMPR